MSLKLGEWKINENGDETTLNISSLDPATGAVSLASAVFGPGGQAQGLWNETSRTICFWGPLPIQGGGSIVGPRFYKGFLFSTPPNPAPGQDVVWTLAGFLEVPDLQGAQGTGANARRNAFGWFAQTTEVA